MMSYDGHFFTGGFMWVFWVLLIAVIFFIIKNMNKGQPGSNMGGETPLDILKKRYARGEIKEEEYEQIRKKIDK